MLALRAWTACEGHPTKSAAHTECAGCFIETETGSWRERGVLKKSGGYSTQFMTRGPGGLLKNQGGFSTLSLV